VEFRKIQRDSAKGSRVPEKTIRNSGKIPLKRYGNTVNMNADFDGEMNRDVGAGMETSMGMDMGIAIDMGMATGHGHEHGHIYVLDMYH
jgi:hypothetical protein